MDLGETGVNLLIVLAIFVLLVLNIFFRKRRVEKAPPEVVSSLLSEINHNQKLMEDSQFHLPVKKV